MVKYRRYYIHGGIYFFTVALRDRKSDFLIKYIKQLIDAFRQTRKLHPFKTSAMVVLPDHLHVIWELPDKDTNFSLRWRCIKTLFVKNILKLGVDIKKNKRMEYLLWQRRFWEHAIRDDNDHEQHINYIHYNPVKHKLVSNMMDWRYSTIHRYARLQYSVYKFLASETDLEMGE